MERIASRQHPLVRRFRDLARARESGGSVLLDGAHLLHEAVRSHVPVDLVAILEEDAPPDAQACAQEAERAGARILRVPAGVLAAMSPVRQPSGIVAIARCSPAPIARCLEARPALVLLLVGVQDPGNVGAIVRAAEACGATAIICSEGTADPFGWKALRGGMGSTFRMPVAVHHPLAAIMEALRERQIAVLASVARNGTPVGACDLRGPVAVMLGAEGAGLPDEAVGRGGRAPHHSHAGRRSSRSTWRSRRR